MDYLSGIENSDFAAALGALDFRFHEERRMHVTEGEHENVAFFFQDRSHCGEHDLGQMARAWDDAEWHRDFPRHPLAYLRVFFRNRHRLRDHFQKGINLAIAWRQGKAHLISLRHDDALMRVKTEPFPAQPPGDLVKVGCESLAAALMAVGVPPYTKKPWYHTGSGVVFQFHPVSPCGQFHAAPLALAWAQEDWYEKHPEHPFAYVANGWRNRDFLQLLIEKAVPTVVMVTGKGLPATLSADASDELQKRFFERLKKHR